MESLRNSFFRYLAQTSPAPLALEIERAEGMYLYGPRGEQYLDMISGISVSNLGHSHSRIIRAVKDQAERYMHLLVYGELIQAPQVLLSEKLAECLPENLHNIYFVNSGAEAVEGAVKLAKRYTARPEIIALSGAYHGSSQGALSVTGNEYLKRAFRPLVPGIRHIRPNNIEDAEFITRRTAAVVLEPVMGEAGIRKLNKEFLLAVRERCNETGALLILDEIQTGLGRTGTLFAFESYNIYPDILLLAKAFGGGMPLGAFVSSKEIMQVLTNAPALGHITTFGGHPVCCAAALAHLQEILESRIYESVPKKEALFRSLLVHPGIREVRSAGLMIAVELGSAEKVQQVIQRALSQGVLFDWFLFCDTAIRIAPPLIITEEQIRIACQVLLECLSE